MLLGLATCGVSTAMLCVGKSVTWLALGRVFEGIAAGLVWIACPALLVDTVGRKAIGKAMGWCLARREESKSDPRTGRLIDGDKWKPDMQVVRVTFEFLKSTGRFAAKMQVSNSS
jgi:hypothetical protein